MIAYIPFEFAVSGNGGAYFGKLLGGALILVSLEYFIKLTKTSLLVLAIFLFKISYTIYLVIPNNLLLNITIRCVGLYTIFIVASNLFRDNQMVIKMAKIFVASTVCLTAVAMLVNNFSISTFEDRLDINNLDSNYLGYYCVFGILSCIFLYYNNENFNRKIATSASACLLVLGLIFTGSRGAYVTLLISMCFVVAFNTRKTRSIVIMSIFAFFSIFIIFGNDYILDRWQNTIEIGNSINTRSFLLEESIEMIKERPIVGWGPYYSRFELGGRLGFLGEIGTHNLFLGEWLDLGILGLVLLLLLLISLAMTSIKNMSLPFVGSYQISLYISLLLWSLTIDSITLKIFWLILALVNSNNLKTRD